MAKKNITIYDIAREAGVSPATVSRILTGSTSVSAGKREQVMQLIEKYNFRPNAFARALTENRSRLIGMVVAHSGNSYYNSLFAACEQEAYRRGYVTMLMNTYSQPEFEESVLSRLAEMRPEAVILSGGRIDLEVPDESFTRLLVHLREMSRVAVASRSPMPGIPGISVDHRGSMDVAIRYLYGLGHREIAFVYTGAPYYGTRERLQQFGETMAQLGLPIRLEWLIPVEDYNIASGIEGVKRLLALPRLPTALLGMNDMVTIGLLQGLLSHGLRVPQDVSLLGFDDTFVTDITTPHLSSVGYDYPAYARMLLDAALYDGPWEEIPHDQRIPVFITERESCAPPPKPGME